MMKKITISKVKYLLPVIGLMIASSCIADLDTIPDDDQNITTEKFYSNPDSYKQVLAKLYAGLAVSGQSGPAGSSDITGIDEGFGQYLRGYWQAQELPTDEAVIAWNDGSLPDYHENDWTSSNEFIRAIYDRFNYQVALCNEFLRQTTGEKLDGRGVSGNLRTEIQTFRAEARLLRALSHYHLLDMFGNVPFFTEEDPVSGYFPEQVDRAFLFNYIESELLDIQDDLVPARNNEYARADQAAAWAILAKLYLNAEVYIGEARYTDCITFCNNIINAGYSLVPQYEYLFLADNDRNGAEQEILFPIAFDGLNTKTYGGTTFLVHAPVGGDMDPVDFGINGGWGGLRTTAAFVDKFTEPTPDMRAMFFTEGQSKEINNIGNFKDGYAITKWKNVTSAGEPGSDTGGDFPDTDFGLFRLAEFYLTYAEAVVRGGAGGSVNDAVNYINMLRERAYGDQSGNINAGNLTLDFLINERARELYWEGHRRTDLIRFGRFTGSAYLWPWKGGVKNGTSIPAYLSLFPIPATELVANPKIQQNPGY